MQEDLFVGDDLKLLMAKQEEWCVSIFMPTHRFTNRVQEDQIRFKNLLKEAEDKLREVGSDGANGLLDPARKLSEDRPFWHHQRDGLALFLAKDLARPYRLPMRFNELVVVTNRFHTKPILPLLTGDGKFYVLALSQNEVRLLLCTRHSVSEVSLEEVPTTLGEALKYDETEKQLQFHTRTPAAMGTRAAMFHGHGAGSDVSKDRILRFFQQLDKGLQGILAEESAPMVLAAVDYLVPLFKQASSYHRILEQTVSGNPEGISATDLHRKAVALVVPHFERDLEDHRALYNELTNTEKSASQIEEVVKAAFHGRIDVLFVTRGVRQWGEFDSSTDKVKLLRQGEPGAGDLLDFAAAQTILNSGIVYAVSPEEMPNGAPVAAIFRY